MTTPFSSKFTDTHNKIENSSHVHTHPRHTRTRSFWRKNKAPLAVGLNLVVLVMVVYLLSKLIQFFTAAAENIFNPLLFAAHRNRYCLALVPAPVPVPSPASASAPVSAFAVRRVFPMAETALCNMLYEELAAEDPEHNKPATLCPYCSRALAFHKRRQQGEKTSSKHKLKFTIISLLLALCSRYLYI
jgi:hypothetical protein